jgi:ubiquitin carboxyl-terminal hydrolase 4/11/15
MDVWNTPELLIVHMKRFQNSRTASDKISTFVDFPLNGLDMAPFVKAQKMVGQTIYDLYAVSNHMGGLGGGHYTAYGKNPINNKWYLFDDSRVSRIEGNVKETVVSSSAYVLFYQRRKPVDTSSTKTAKTD